MYIKPDNTFRTDNEQELTQGEVAMHGDVYIVPVESDEATLENAVKEPNNRLAYGEFTGHAHKLFDGDFSLQADAAEPLKARALKVVAPTSLRHQEHTPIKLPPGDYVIGIQQEYDPFEKRIRSVQD